MLMSNTTMQYHNTYSNDKINQLLNMHNNINNAPVNDTQMMHLILEDLQPYMFSSSNMEKYSHCEIMSNVTPVTKHKKDVFVPKHKDTLFWCFYVLHMGIDKYSMIGNKYFVEEKELKFKMIELIRSKKDILKMHKIKPITDIENDLTNNPQITLKTFIALCVITNISVMVVDKKKYFENTHISADSSNNTYVIHKSIGEPVKYSLDLTPCDAEKINYYKENYYNMASLDNKLKSITSYKYADLVEICKKLGIEQATPTNAKKKTKAELYEMIILNL